MYGGGSKLKLASQTWVWSQSLEPPQAGRLSPKLLAGCRDQDSKFEFLRFFEVINSIFGTLFSCFKTFVCLKLHVRGGGALASSLVAFLATFMKVQKCSEFYWGGKIKLSDYLYDQNGNM